MKKTIVLERSTNTHKMTGNVKVVKSFSKMNTMVIDIEGGAQIKHHEHHTVSTNPSTRRIIKINQVETNPISGALQAAFD